MRVFGLPFLALLLIVSFAQSQATAAEPQFRPALIGNGPKALVNLIDKNKLVAKGQRDGALFFQCYVNTKGGPANAITYRGTPESKALEKEVIAALERCQFIPAIYKGQPTGVFFLGTVLFFVNDGRPHLHIYANQNHGDLIHGNDFIAPQMIGGTDDWLRAKAELEKGRPQNVAVELAITVDANGIQKALKVVSEDPPGLNFGHAASTLFSTAQYIPGFRNGRPVDCTFNCDCFFRAHRN